MERAMREILTLFMEDKLGKQKTFNLPTWPLLNTDPEPL